MGGNAFPKLNLRRIRREEVDSTVEYLTNLMSFDGFSFDYARNSLMGSVGKQADSGDLDFVLNDKPARFVGEAELPLFNIKRFAARMEEVLPRNQLSFHTLNGGQFQSAWPIEGDPQKGFVQCDFLAGDPEWMKFSHYSPGKDVSPWKGVFMSTMYGVMAKMLVDYDHYLGGDPEGERMAEVGWHFDLEKGLHRKWRMQLRPGQGIAQVDPDAFETRFPDAPRLPRLGYLTNPTVVLSVLFEDHVEHSDVDTFEKLVQKVREKYPRDFEAVKERFLEALMRSAARNEYTKDEMELALGSF